MDHKIFGEYNVLCKIITVIRMLMYFEITRMSSGTEIVH